MSNKSPPNLVVLWVRDPGTGESEDLTCSQAMGQGCGHLSACLELKQPCPSSRSWLWQLRFLTGWTWTSPEGCLQQGSSLPPAEVIQERERDCTPSKEPERESKMEAAVCFKPNPGSDVSSRPYSAPKSSPYSTGIPSWFHKEAGVIAGHPRSCLLYKWSCKGRVAQVEGLQVQRH